MSTAAGRVISTPELLENILLELSLYDLLVNAQLVSRTFFIAIDSSPLIQQKLFFEPAAANSTPEPNPLLYMDNSFRFRHPQTQKPASLWQRWAYTSCPGCAACGTLRPLERTSNSERKAAFQRPEATWRKMLVVQPPVTELKVGLAATPPLMLKDDVGIRMEMLEDVLITKWGMLGRNERGGGWLNACRRAWLMREIRCYARHEQIRGSLSLV